MNLISGVLLLLLAAAADAGASGGSNKCPARRLPNGRIIVTAVSFTCKYGYTLDGDSSQTCSGGKWNALLPKCRVTRCPILKNPTNGRVNVTNRKVGAKATFQCNRGYERDGPASVRCRSTGEWSLASPKCNPTCVHLSWSPVPNAPTSYYVCNNGVLVIGTCSSGKPIFAHRACH